MWHKYSGFLTIQSSACIYRFWLPCPPSDVGWARSTLAHQVMSSIGAEAALQLAGLWRPQKHSCWCWRWTSTSSLDLAGDQSMLLLPVFIEYGSMLHVIFLSVSHLEGDGHDTLYLQCCIARFFDKELIEMILSGFIIVLPPFHINCC
jgi:hypothetical protein